MSTIQPYNNVTIYTYISPWLLEKLYRKLCQEFRPFTFVSYFYPLPKKVARPKKTYIGYREVFVYEVV